MGNLGVGLKRFLGNRNTITIIAVIAGIVVLYLGYNWRVNQAVDPIQVPFAAQTIGGGTEITREMISTISVNRSITNLSRGMITTTGGVQGWFVNYDTTIHEGSFFFRDQISQERVAPDQWIADIEEGYTIYPLTVNMQSTFGNSIMPGNRIDLFLSAIDDNNELVLFGRFIESIEVLDVRDSRGIRVFSSMTNAEPNTLVFAVPDDQFFLLRTADLIRTNNIQITPVPRNRDFTENPGETIISSREIEYFIRARAREFHQNDPGQRPDPIPTPEPDPNGNGNGNGNGQNQGS